MVNSLRAAAQVASSITSAFSRPASYDTRNVYTPPPVYYEQRAPVYYQEPAYVPQRSAYVAPRTYAAPAPASSPARSPAPAPRPTAVATLKAAIAKAPASAPAVATAARRMTPPVDVGDSGARGPAAGALERAIMALGNAPGQERTQGHLHGVPFRPADTEPRTAFGKKAQAPATPNPEAGTLEPGSQDPRGDRARQEQASQAESAYGQAQHQQFGHSQVGDPSRPGGMLGSDMRRNLEQAAAMASRDTPMPGLGGMTDVQLLRYVQARQAQQPRTPWGQPGFVGPEGGPAPGENPVRAGNAYAITNAGRSAAPMVGPPPPGPPPLYGHPSAQPAPPRSVSGQSRGGMGASGGPGRLGDLGSPPSAPYFAPTGDVHRDDIADPSAYENTTSYRYYLDHFGGFTGDPVQDARLHGDAIRYTQQAISSGDDTLYSGDNGSVLPSWGGIKDAVGTGLETNPLTGPAIGAGDWFAGAIPNASSVDPELVNAPQPTSLSAQQDAYDAGQGIGPPAQPPYSALDQGQPQGGGGGGGILDTLTDAAGSAWDWFGGLGGGDEKQPWSPGAEQGNVYGDGSGGPYGPGLTGPPPAAEFPYPASPVPQAPNPYANLPLPGGQGAPAAPAAGAAGGPSQQALDLFDEFFAVKDANQGGYPGEIVDPSAGGVGGGYDGGGYGGGGGYDSYYGGGGYDYGGGYYGGGGGYSGGGGAAPGSGDDGTDPVMGGWASRYRGEGAQAILENPGSIARDTLADLGVVNDGLAELLSSRLIEISKEIIPVIEAYADVGKDPNPASLINFLHEIALMLLQDQGADFDVAALARQWFSKDGGGGSSLYGLHGRDVTVPAGPEEPI